MAWNPSRWGARVGILIGTALWLLGVASAPAQPNDESPPSYYADPLSLRLDDPALPSSDLLRSGPTLPLHGHIAHRVCRGDREMRLKLFASIQELPRVSPDRVFSRIHGHGAILSACIDKKPMCGWIREYLGPAPSGPVHPLFWGRLATCGDLQDRWLFEQGWAPEDALHAFAEAAGKKAYSDRLEKILRRHVEDRDADTLARTVHAFASQETERVTAVLIELLEDDSSEAVRRVLWSELMRSDDPGAAAVGHKACRTHALHKAMKSTRRNRAPGDPCSTSSRYPSLRGMTEQEPRIEPEFNRQGVLWSFLDENARWLRNATLLVRPDLDGAIFFERLPALEAIPRGPDDTVQQFFANGDAVLGMLPRGSDPLHPESAARAVAEIEAALGMPHEIDVYFAACKFTWVVEGPEFPSSAELIPIINELLEAVGSGHRITFGEHGAPIAIPAGGAP